MADPSDILAVEIYATDIEILRELVGTHPYDFGCRPHVFPVRDGVFMTPAFVTNDQLSKLQNENFDVQVKEVGIPIERRSETTVGKGDRFNGGQIAPHGLGFNNRNNADLGRIMNAKEIESAMNGLMPDGGIDLIGTADQTAENRDVIGGVVGGTKYTNEDVYVYFTAGMHARERGGPDSLIYFIADLLDAKRSSTGLTYGNVSYSNADVLRALGTGIVFIPLVNPDGVAYDQKTDTSWRKNRNPAGAFPWPPGSPNVLPDSIGVDINRNFDFLWDFSTFFDPVVTPASNDPISILYHGASPCSEAESKYVASIFDTYPNIRWYMDIHSYGPDLLFSWGNDNNQAGDPTMNFLNPLWNSQRGVIGKPDYMEWIEKGNWTTVQLVAQRVCGTVNTALGQNYRPMQSADFSAVSGASDDYAFSRFQTTPLANKVYAFTFEFGQHHFYPTLQEFHQNVLDTSATLMEFCLAAADFGLTDP